MTHLLIPFLFSSRSRHKCDESHRKLRDSRTLVYVMEPLNFSRPLCTILETVPIGSSLLLPPFSPHLSELASRFQRDAGQWKVARLILSFELIDVD